MLRIENRLAIQVRQTDDLVFHQNPLSNDVLHKQPRVVSTRIGPQINHMGVNVHPVGFYQPDDIAGHAECHGRIETISSLNLEMH